MRRVAFIDVDMTLVDNQASSYNDALIEHLATAGFDAFYLVTGRNVNDFWQHVLQMGNKPHNWRLQLLGQIKTHLEQCHVNISAISMPYDHYLIKQNDEPFGIVQAGDSAESFYLAFERCISDYRDEAIDNQLLHKVFREMTLGDIYAESPYSDTKQSLADALPMYLAMTGDTDKEGQLGCLLERVARENDEPLEVIFFDDKPENLEAARRIFKNDTRISSYTAHLVDSYDVSNGFRH
ncbi:MAG: hypothetical protein P1U32_09060 [Legionellaceae bacterium]|nr:hypothetical protein [Legionellaceae bacterium]